MDKTKEKFVAFAADLNYADLTPDAVHAVKRCVVDAIGCALGAFHAEPVKAVRALASRVTAAAPANGQCAGIGGGTQYLPLSDPAWRYLQLEGPRG